MKKLLNTLYVTNPDAYVRKQDDAVNILVDNDVIMSIPFHVLEGLVLFGHVGCSTALLRECGARGVAVALLDERGRFLARIQGPVSGNVLLRRAQFSKSADCDYSLEMAKRFVAGKLHNSRIALRRCIRDYGENRDVSCAADRLSDASGSVAQMESLDELRGVEGDAARAYFGVFDHLIRVENSSSLFRGRSRRPPQDPVNAMLSFYYSLLARECGTACESVGLDPQVGFLHADRPGRSSLALDLMEELRAPFVDRFVLSLFNRRQVVDNDFEHIGDGVVLSDRARKESLNAWQQRKQETVTHPFLKEKVPLGLIPFLQAQLLARVLRGDLDDYPAFLWR